MRISDWSSDVCSSDLVEPGLFDKPAFTAGIIGMALFFSAFIGMQLVFTLFLQFGHGFSAGQAGLAGLPLAIGAFVGSGLAGGFLEINSQPDRLDLTDTHARAAGEAGVGLVVDTDAPRVQLGRAHV